MSLDPIDFSDLKNKTAVITGGAGVLCTSFAEALASVGANLALLDLNEEAAVELAGRLQAETGVQTIGIQADVLSEESLVVAREIIHSELGSVDILVNGAGGNAPSATTGIEQLSDPGDLESSFFGLKLDGFKSAFDLNFIGTMLPTQVLAWDMVERRKGAIINISSMDSRLFGCQIRCQQFHGMVGSASGPDGHPGQRNCSRLLSDRTAQISGF